MKILGAIITLWIGISATRQHHRVIQPVPNQTYHQSIVMKEDGTFATNSVPDYNATKYSTIITNARVVNVTACILETNVSGIAIKQVCREWELDGSDLPTYAQATNRLATIATTYINRQYPVSTNHTLRWRFIRQ